MRPLGLHHRHQWGRGSMSGGRIRWRLISEGKATCGTASIAAFKLPLENLNSDLCASHNSMETLANRNCTF